MKYTLSLCLLGILLFGCSPKVSFPPGYFNNGKTVGVAFEIKPINVFKEGRQGILDQALTPGNKYREALSNVDKKIGMDTLLLDFLKYAYTDGGKPIKVISKNFMAAGYQKLRDFDVNQRKSFYKYDLRAFKEQGIDELLIVEANYGILASYYGFLLINIEGISELDVRVVDLADNSLIFSRKAKGKAPIPDLWNAPPDYRDLETSIKTAIIKSLQGVKEDFEKQK